MNEQDAYRRLARVLPVWARRCLKAGHDLSLVDKADGRVEVFCGDCLDGAGQGEILTATQTALLIQHFDGRN